MPSQPPDAREIIAQVAAGTMSVDDAVVGLGIAETAPIWLESLSDNRSDNRAAMQSIDGATVDLGRRERCGFSEVIYGEGKKTSLIAEIIETQQRAGQSSLVTRLDPSAAESLQEKFPSGHYNALARTFRTAVKNFQPPCPAPKKSFHAAVVTAGSTDAPVAEEAIETLVWMGIPYERFDDIGVAGPQRLLAAVPRIRQASAVVVIAGMEGALPAAIAGHLSVPIFAVPTSVGYGATLGGLTPLLGMLSSCASNVAAVNIDAGFKGGYLAGIVVHQLLVGH